MPGMLSVLDHHEAATVHRGFDVVPNSLGCAGAAEEDNGCGGRGGGVVVGLVEDSVEAYAVGDAEGSGDLGYRMAGCFGVADRLVVHGGGLVLELLGFG